jgi:hypothetical protein
MNMLPIKNRAIQIPFLAAAIFLSLPPSLAISQTTETSNIPLPSPELKKYLASTSVGKPAVAQGPTTTVQVKKVPKDSIYFEMIVAKKSIQLPLQSSNQLLILLNPTLKGENVQEAMEKHRLSIVRAIPDIGAIIVDTSRRLPEAPTAVASASVLDAKKSQLDALAIELQKDDRFLAVTPNSAVSSFMLKAAATPIMDNKPTIGASSERTDWGIKATGFDKIWPRMTTPFMMGVIDVGFSAHEDLDTSTGLPVVVPVADHGNHVAGIMCAKHNGIGVKGALKNCRVVESTAVTMLNGDAAPEGSDRSQFITRFSEPLATVLEFIEANPTIRVINLSLGYNWMPNFKVDPRASGNEQIRNDIKTQARFFAAVLAVAKARNIAVVMAAGNDSSSLNPPLEAEWASPFNYAVKLMVEKDGWANALVVEAYDRDQHRALFSNISTDVSCPGVDILSTLGSGPRDYGELSGTSMASPYCAAGLAAILQLRPDLSLREALNCARSGPDKIEARIPKFDVSYSVEKCKKS